MKGKTPFDPDDDNVGLGKMTPQMMRERFAWLVSDDSAKKTREKVIWSLMVHLMAAEGAEVYSTELTWPDSEDSPAPPDPDKDFIVIARYQKGEKEPIWIEYRDDLNPLTPREAGRFVGAKTRTGKGFSRKILVSRGAVPRSQLAGTYWGIKMPNIQLLDFQAISRWIDRIEAIREGDGNQVQILIRALSHELARQISLFPSALNQVEWRDLERVMARVLEGLGFRTELTPSSKDGGKDIIVRLHCSKEDDSYIVELKHWRAGKKVGEQSVTDFLNVVIREGRQGGIFLSSSGYVPRLSESLTEVTRQRVHLGNSGQIVTLAQTYMKASSGLWSPPEKLPDVLFEHTLGFDAGKPRQPGRRRRGN